MCSLSPGIFPLGSRARKILPTSFAHLPLAFTHCRPLMLNSLSDFNIRSHFNPSPALAAVRMITERQSRLVAFLLIVMMTWWYRRRYMGRYRPRRRAPPALIRDPRRNWDQVRRTVLGRMYITIDRFCHEQLRMRRSMFHRLCTRLHGHGLRESRHVTLEEQVAPYRIFQAEMDQLPTPKPLKKKDKGSKSHHRKRQVIEEIKDESHLLKKKRTEEIDETKSQEELSFKLQETLDQAMDDKINELRKTYIFETSDSEQGPVEPDTESPITDYGPFNEYDESSADDDVDFDGPNHDIPYVKIEKPPPKVREKNQQKMKRR